MYINDKRKLWTIQTIYFRENLILNLKKLSPGWKKNLDICYHLLTYLNRSLRIDWHSLPFAYETEELLWIESLASFKDLS